jgi:hypothetical protein
MFRDAHMGCRDDAHGRSSAVQGLPRSRTHPCHGRRDQYQHAAVLRLMAVSHRTALAITEVQSIESNIRRWHELAMPFRKVSRSDALPTKFNQPMHRRQGKSEIGLVDEFSVFDFVGNPANDNLPAR